MRLRPLALVVLLAASAASAASLTRGPYLQLAGPTGITVVFRTDAPAVGRVRYGTSPQALTASVVDTAAGTQHVLKLQGLTPSTRYFYAVDLDGAPVATGDSLRFRTYPTPGTEEAFRLFAWGDSGTGNAAQLAVADRMAAQVGDAALSLILGDIIYDAGEAQNYDPRYFSPYAPLLRRMVVWPTIGNHDVGLDPTGGPYLDAFYLPTNNGLGTELYYSFDYGNAHFVCLDTHVSGHGPGSMQLQWAAADLAASSAKWKFVYFHVPPYSGGTHSDNAGVRDNILPVLEAAGVDVVFSGHSHVYERTWLLKNNAVVQNDASRYTKPTPGTGTLYVVSGTAGQSGALSNPTHPLMAFQVGNVLGTSVIDVTGDTLHGYFLEASGNVRDLFEVSKAADTRPPRVLGLSVTSPTELVVSFDEPVAGGALAGGAERVSSYTISPPISVVGATLGADQRTVTLSTQAHAPGAYTLTVRDVQDRASPPNAMQPSPALPYAISAPVELVPPAGPWTYLVGAAAPPAAWASATFDDTAWSSGPQPLGYGDPGLGTTVNMGSAVTLYTRTRFTRPTGAVQGLTLELDYDDAFVAYVNGVEVARRYVPAGQDHTTRSTASHEHGTVERFAIPDAEALLRAGDNVLAVEVHNTDVTSSDLWMSARLEALVAPLAPDAGTPMDAGVDDAGTAEDAGSATDAGTDDAGVTMDAGTGTDAGTMNGGTGTPGATPGCGCSAGPGGMALALLAVATRLRRRRG